MSLAFRQSCKWSAMNLSETQLQFFPNLADGYLNKRSQKKGTRLDHKDNFYADDAAFIFLSKKYLIKGTTFVRESFAQFASKSTSDQEKRTQSQKQKQCIS